MKILKSLIVIFMAIFAQVVPAQDWTHINLKQDGHTVRVSYTKRYLPATIGSRGGMASGELYIDVYSQNGQKAESVEIFGKRRVLNEQSATHAWIKVTGLSYGDVLWSGEKYQITVVVDGRELEFNFQAL